MSISPTAKANKVVNIPTVNDLNLSLLVCFLSGFINESIVCGLKKNASKNQRCSHFAKTERASPLSDRSLLWAH